MYGLWGLDNSSLFPPEQAAGQGPEKESDLSAAVLITHTRNCSMEDLLEKGSAAGRPNRNSNNTAENVHGAPMLCLALVSQLTVVFHPAAYSVTSKSHFDLQVQ